MTMKIIQSPGFAHVRQIALATFFGTLLWSPGSYADVAEASAASAAGATGAVEVIDDESGEIIGLADDIWGFAEVGYQETRSSGALQEYLRANGFDVQTGIAGIPTAFVATAGEGKPEIAVLAEFDALPGLSQAALPERSPVTKGAPGHACGHHMFGAASTGAGVALARWLAANKVKGTIKVIGTPGGRGRFRARYILPVRGFFANTDTVLHWHPADSKQRISLFFECQQIWPVSFSRSRRTCGFCARQRTLCARRCGKHELHGEHDA